MIHLTREIRSCSSSLRTGGTRSWRNGSTRTATISPFSCREKERRSSSMSDVFGTRGRIRTMLEVEAALAEVLASLSVIPSSAALAIRDAARAELYDETQLIDESRRAGNLAIPLVRALTEKVSSSNKDAALYVHWGATSQDIIDTALVLQIRE